MKNRTIYISIIFLFLALSNYNSIASNSSEYIKQKNTLNKLLSIIKEDREIDFQVELSVINSESINAGVRKVNGDSKRYKIEITKSMLEKVIENDDNRLAFILAHEIGHIVLGHFEFCISHHSKSNTNFINLVYSRENEFDADRFAFETIIKAGYSYKAAIGSLRKMSYYNNLSSIESTTSDYPNWEERLIKIDTSNYQLWELMSEFKTGVFFLQINNFQLAQNCFREVTKQFPDCYEAHSNLGYSLLMKYISYLDIEDLKNFGLRAVAAGAFYTSSESLLSQVRGIDSEIWYEAEGVLINALRLNSNSAICYSNLGLLHIFHHSGKPNYKKSQEYFEKAIELVESDTNLSLFARTAILINAGASLSELNNNERIADTYQEASNLILSFGSSDSKYSSLKNILYYNEAIQLYNSIDRKDLLRAKELFEQYLYDENYELPFWQIAREYYNKICKKLVVIGKDFSLKKIDSKFKPIFFIQIDSMKIELGDRVSKYSDFFINNRCIKSRLISGKNLNKYSLKQYGLDIIANDIVLAIFLSGKNSPEIYLQNSSNQKDTLIISASMKYKEVTNILKDIGYSFDLNIMNNVDNFKYFPSLNLGFQKSNKDSSCIIAVVYKF